ncbi:MAG: DNA repair exonuclease [Clostridiales bacterium]|jgi:DNA repair exonuclease SbcCD nuclease subunit|nr:DNA repair exonuclease [Clostridiales bacterium]
MSNDYRTLKALHCADLHLGAPFSGLGAVRQASRLEDQRNAFSKIIELCRREDAEILLIAGDLFDSARPAEDLVDMVRDGFSSIRSVKVLISPGNHDPASAGSIYLYEDFWPDNVYIFKGSLEKTMFEDLGLIVWGAGFTGAYQDKPLFDLRLQAGESGGFINICLMHADVVKAGALSAYNPISEQAISASGIDYFALGHVHKRKEALRLGSSYYSYPGSPEGLGFDEPGARGVHIGQIGGGICAMRFQPVSQRAYFDIDVDVSGIGRPGIAEEIKRAVKRLAGDGYEGNLYRVHLCGEVDEGGVLSVENISAALPELFYLKVIDGTRVVVDKKAHSGDNSLRGLFVKKMIEKLEENPEDESLQLALKLGLRAFSGKVNCRV